MRRALLANKPRALSLHSSGPSGEYLAWTGS